VEGVNDGWKAVYGEAMHPEYKRQLDIQQNSFRKIVNDRVELYGKAEK
jgi:hypothetical protein